MKRIKVAVSPFYGGESWTDEKTGITFETNPRGLNVYSIPANADTRGIQRAIRLNQLMLVEGEIEKYNEVNEVVVDEVKEEAPVVEEKEEAKPEPKEEAKEEEPAPKKKAPAKKKTTKKSE